MKKVIYTEEIDKIIARAMKRASKFSDNHERYYPREGSYQYKELEEKLAGRIITENGLKYPYEVGSGDSPLNLMGNDESESSS